MQREGGHGGGEEEEEEEEEGETMVGERWSRDSGSDHEEECSAPGSEEELAVSLQDVSVLRRSLEEDEVIHSSLATTGSQVCWLPW